MGSGPLTEEDLLAIQRQQVAYQETPITQSKRIFQDHAAAAAQSIVNLAIHSKNERTRLTAAQYVTERVLGRIQDDPPTPVDDPFTKLWAELTTTPAPVEPPINVNPDILKAELETELEDGHDA